MSTSKAAPTTAEKSTSAVCVNCQLTLPIRPVRDGETGKNWKCVRCGTHYHAILLLHAPAKCANNVEAVVAAPPKKSQSLLQGDGPIGKPQGTSKEPLRSRGEVTCHLQTQASRAIDSAVQRGGNLAVQSSGPAFANNIQKYGAVPYDLEVEQKMVEDFQGSVQQVESLVASLEQGYSVARDAHETIVRETLLQATNDLDLFVRIGGNPLGEGYPGQHSLHTSMLASAIGANLGWDQETLIDLGVGCLIHDIGMVKVSNQVQQKSAILNEEDFGKITSHPLHTFDILEDYLSRVPLASRMVAFQMHERCDGSGYPRKRKKELIHEAAKVAAVADVYIALVSPRPHRPALMPYYAIEHLVYGVKKGEYDGAVVRSLLKTISLFPIGSYVQLSDGRVARILRSGTNDYSRPVVETWRRGELNAPPLILDLAKESSLVIQAPLESLAGTP